MTRLCSPLLALLNVNFVVYIAAQTFPYYPPVNAQYNPAATTQAPYYNPSTGQYISPNQNTGIVPPYDQYQSVNNVDDSFDPSRWGLQANQAATSPTQQQYNPYAWPSSGGLNDGQMTFQPYPPPSSPQTGASPYPPPQNWAGTNPSYDPSATGGAAQSSTDPPPNAVYTDPQGNYYDAQGNLIPDSTPASPYDPNAATPSTDPPPNAVYSDDKGNFYDAQGILIPKSTPASPYDPNAATPSTDPPPNAVYMDEKGNYYDEQGKLIPASPYDPNAAGGQDTDIYTDGTSYFKADGTPIDPKLLVKDKDGNVYYAQPPQSQPQQDSNQGQNAGQQQWVDPYGYPIDVSQYSVDEQGKVFDAYGNEVDPTGWRLATPAPAPAPAPKPAPSPPPKYTPPPPPPKYTPPPPPKSPAPAPKPAPKPTPKPAPAPAPKPAPKPAKKPTTKPSKKKAGGNKKPSFKNGSNSLNSWYKNPSGRKSGLDVDGLLNSYTAPRTQKKRNNSLRSRLNNYFK